MNQTADLFEFSRLAGMTRRERQNEFRRRRRENPEYRARENAMARARRARKRGAGGNGAVAGGGTQSANRQYFDCQVQPVKRIRRQFYDRRFRQWVSR